MYRCTVAYSHRTAPAVTSWLVWPCALRLAPCPSTSAALRAHYQCQCQCHCSSTQANTYYALLYKLEFPSLPYRHRFSLLILTSTYFAFNSSSRQPDPTTSSSAFQANPSPLTPTSTHHSHLSLPSSWARRLFTSALETLVRLPLLEHPASQTRQLERTTR